METTNEKKDLCEKQLREYTTPKIEVTFIEMETGIAAGSGTALPANSTTPKTETWDNSDITNDTPIYW